MTVFICFPLQFPWSRPSRSCSGQCPAGPRPSPRSSGAAKPRPSVGTVSPACPAARSRPAALRRPRPRESLRRSAPDPTHHVGFSPSGRPCGRPLLAVAAAGHTQHAAPGDQAFPVAAAPPPAVTAAATSAANTQDTEGNACALSPRVRVSSDAAEWAGDRGDDKRHSFFLFDRSSVMGLLCRPPRCKQFALCPGQSARRSVRRPELRSA